MLPYLVASHFLRLLGSWRHVSRGRCDRSYVSADQRATLRVVERIAKRGISVILNLLFVFHCAIVSCCCRTMSMGYDVVLIRALFRCVAFSSILHQTATALNKLWVIVASAIEKSASADAPQPLTSPGNSKRLAVVKVGDYLELIEKHGTQLFQVFCFWRCYEYL